MANIGSLDAWFLALVQPPALLELAALAACIGLAWLLTALARQSAGEHDTRSIWFGHQSWLVLGRLRAGSGAFRAGFSLSLFISVMSFLRLWGR